MSWRSNGRPPYRLAGSIAWCCRSTPFHASRWNRFVTGTIATAALNSVGFRKIESSVIIPPWLQPMIPMRAGSTCGYFAFSTSTAVTTSSTSRAAVVDRVVERLAVADAAAILRRDDDVALGGRFADVRNVVLVEMAADVLVHPDERRVPLWRRAASAAGRRSRDVHVARLAAVGDLLHLHEAVAGGAPRLVGLAPAARPCDRSRAAWAGTRRPGGCAAAGERATAGGCAAAGQEPTRNVKRAAANARRACGAHARHYT